MSSRNINLIKRLSVGVREPNLVPLDNTSGVPEFANPSIHVQGIGSFYLLGKVPYKRAFEIRDELQGDLDVAKAERKERVVA